MGCEAEKGEMKGFTTDQLVRQKNRGQNRREEKTWARKKEFSPTLLADLDVRKRGGENEITNRGEAAKRKGTGKRRRRRVNDSADRTSGGKKETQKIGGDIMAI